VARKKKVEALQPYIVKTSDLISSPVVSSPVVSSPWSVVRCPWSENERGDAEVEGEGDEVSYGKCDRTSGDLRVEFQ
jgi:hypothetical protein